MEITMGKLINDGIHPASEATATYYPQNEFWPKELKIKLITVWGCKTAETLYQWTANYAGNPDSLTAKNSQSLAPRGNYKTRKNAIRYAKRLGWIVEERV